MRVLSLVIPNAALASTVTTEHGVHRLTPSAEQEAAEEKGSERLGTVDAEWQKGLDEANSRSGSREDASDQDQFTAKVNDYGRSSSSSPANLLLPYRLSCVAWVDDENIM